MMGPQTAPALFIALIVAHCVCDYPLQGDFLARGKNYKNPIPGVPWSQCLWAHGIIHGGAVWLLTGSAFLGSLECVCHVWIDFGKCAGRYDFNVDQALHWACKVAWAACWLYWRS